MWSKQYGVFTSLSLNFYFTSLLILNYPNDRYPNYPKVTTMYLLRAALKSLTSQQSLLDLKCTAKKWTNFHLQFYLKAALLAPLAVVQKLINEANELIEGDFDADQSVIPAQAQDKRPAEADSICKFWKIKFLNC